jgi:hypothetical protein
MAWFFIRWDNVPDLSNRRLQGAGRIIRNTGLASRTPYFTCFTLTAWRGGCGRRRTLLRALVREEYCTILEVGLSQAVACRRSRGRNRNAALINRIAAIAVYGVVRMPMMPMSPMIMVGMRMRVMAVRVAKMSKAGMAEVAGMAMRGCCREGSARENQGRSGCGKREALKHFNLLIWTDGS